MSTTLQRMNPRALIAGLLGGDSTIKSLVSHDPGTALALVADCEDRQLSIPMRAQAIDEVLGLISDPEKARRVLNDHVVPSSQAELVAAHGDLYSVILQVADQEVVLAALAQDAGDDHQVGAALLIRAWAQNLKDREDYDELLQMEVGEYTLYNLLLAAIRSESRSPTPDMWEGVGLDPFEAQQDFEELLASGRLPNINEIDVELARRNLRERGRVFESATSKKVVALLLDEVEI